MPRHLKTLAILIILLLCAPAVRGGEPYCTVRSYDERDGLSQHLVKQVVQDDNGVLWVATWNGLNRFDGNEFRCIRPGINDDVRRYSSRIGDIKLGLHGALWCRIDSRVMRFDVDTYTFHDSHTRLEERLGRRFSVKSMAVTVDGETVLTLSDGGYIVLPAVPSPEDEAVMTDDISGKKLRSTGNRKLGSVGPYKSESLVLSRRDDAGTVWLVTRDGEVVSAPGVDGPFTVMADLATRNQSLRYCTTDAQGNVWLCSKKGLHCLTLGSAPYDIDMSAGAGSMLRTSYYNAMRGELWQSWSDAEMLTVTVDDDSTCTFYVRPDGSFSRGKARFGASVYSIIPTSYTDVWLGTKPDGLYRFASEGEFGPYVVSHFEHDADNPASPSGTAYYDGTLDAHGRLWLASMGTGIDVVVSPDEASPGFTRLGELKGYPEDASKVRRLMIIGDTLGVAATTGGLLSFNIPEPFVPDSIRFTLHVSEPGRASSLGNVATMDVCMGDDGELYVATESDGVARVTSPLTCKGGDRWEFCSYHPGGCYSPDVALSVSPWGEGDTLLVTSGRELYLLDPSTGVSKVFGRSFWHREMSFSDARPVRDGCGDWIVGLNDGALRVTLDADMTPTEHFPIVFTSVSIAGQPDSLLTPLTDRIVLRPSERNVTLRFSALCYTDAPSVRYAFRVGDGEWTELEGSRTVTFADLAPGTYEVTVRSTDTYGRWLDNDKSVLLDVLPTFWETGWAKALYILLLLGVVAVVAWTVMYVRRIKRLQRETLEEHLRLLESRAAAQDVRQHDVESVAAVPEAAPQADDNRASRLSPDDRQLMDSLLEYIEANLSDSSVSVDDMAAAVAVSRSGLTRKMKSLMGVTPAEFLRETRLTRASTLLSTTNIPIKEIAVDCGFSDMNYFGKCFKASRGVTPGAYRKGAAE